MEITVVCPANCATGGTEALHLFVSELDKIVKTRLWFWDIKSDPPMPQEFEFYNCEYIKELPSDYSGVLVFPEIWANRVLDFPNCKTAIYWLGVDAYAGWTPPSMRGDFLSNDKVLHLAQSEYAKDFLEKLGVKRLLKCDDTVNRDFYSDYQETERGDAVLYNPAKATGFMNQIMSNCPEIEFKPITGMTRAEVIDTMRRSKLYIDFGEFPGRERMPREAVLSGCCIITSKIGSAAYHEDFAHDYKFDSKEGHIWAIKRKMIHVLSNYETCKKDFDLFRKKLRDDVKKIPEQCGEIVRALYEV